ncbi:MAG: PAS domain S-box protein [Gemmatimonadota bacterium]
MGIRTFLNRIFGRRDPDGREPASSASPALSLAHFERMVEIAADAIISVDDTMTILLFNRGAQEIFGYTRDEIVGQALDVLIPERFRPHHTDHIRRIAGSDETARHMGERREIAGLRKGGEEFPAEATISHLEAGGRAFYTVVLRATSSPAPSTTRPPSPAWRASPCRGWRIGV